MNKCWVALLIALGLASCSAKNEYYYQTHPDELQQALKACPERQPQGLTCEQMETLATRMNELAYQLQMSPQGFGQKIIALQEAIAKEQNQLNTERNNENLEASLMKKKQDLADHLAVVRWFESPKS
ncbi:hypothetical protein [Legionella cincinnatiensis]|uniref:Secreted endonuclease n=1 Tax=Legionella cincinnatiensis TaxID=28085 RepID=A0A378IKG6_9GAMM|nr:hypothetical protein [Legionella cincinnatiensis]KTC83111.1 secreted endonuclease [Legionella cincinnatiensis]STX35758.1 secreted endonuclease [Legionella cincinnatiensis]